MEKKAIQITWEDSVLYSKYLNSKEIRDIINSPQYVDSIGWLISEDETCIVISQSLSGDVKGAILRIPKSLIRDKKFLDLKTIAVGVTLLLLAFGVSRVTISLLSKHIDEQIAQGIQEQLLNNDYIQTDK